MEQQKKMVIDDQMIQSIQKLKSLSVAFNEKEFLLIINRRNQEDQNGYLLSIPKELMAEIIRGLYSSGLDYQHTFQTDIGFIEEGV